MIYLISNGLLEEAKFAGDGTLNKLLIGKLSNQIISLGQVELSDSLEEGDNHVSERYLIILTRFCSTLFGFLLTRNRD